MAYMSQENKKEIAPQIKDVLKKYNMKGSISVRHHSVLVVTIKEGALDIIGNVTETSKCPWDTKNMPGYMDVNLYWLDEHFTGDVLNFIKELKDAMNGAGSTGEQNFDDSDVQFDYHHVGWYNTVKIGKWDKPFICTSTEEKII